MINLIQLFSFTMYKSNSSGDIRQRVPLRCGSSRLKMFEIGIKLFQPPDAEHEEHSDYSSLYTKNFGQSKTKFRRQSPGVKCSGAKVILVIHVALIYIK